MKRYLIGLIAVAGFMGCSSHETKPTAEVASPATPAFPLYEEAGSLTWKESRGPASNEKCAKAINRIKQAGCYLSGNDENRIRSNGDICKHIESGTGKTEMEVILLERSDKVVTVTTRGAQRSGNWCPTVKYDVDSSGISDVKIIKNKAYMVSNDGQVYFMYTDGSFYELLNSSRNSYKSVADIKGIDLLLPTNSPLHLSKIPTFRQIAEAFPSSP